MLLKVRGLSTHFFTPDGVVRAVDDVSFDVGYGETLGLVGESGCGKSVSALSIARLVPNPPGRIVAGSVVFDGIDVLKLNDDGIRKLRGKEIGFIFQDPLTSLNPTLTIGYQIAEAIREHMGLSEKAAKDRVVELLSKVGIPRATRPPERLPVPVLGRHAPARDDRDRAVVRPEADPRRRADDGARRHDPGPDPGAHRDALGRVRDGRPVDHPRPRHRRRDVRPRQRDVCRPDRRDRDRRRAVREARRCRTPGVCSTRCPQLDDVRGEKLRTIEGMPPLLINPPDACRFHPRCPYARDLCREDEPELTPRGNDRHLARCWATEPGGWIS